MTDRRLDLMLYVATLEGGGAERVFVRLANHYAAEGRRVALLVNRPDGPIARLVSPDVRVIAAGGRNAVRSVPRLVGILKREGPRAVICGLTTANLAMVMATKIVELTTGTRPRLMVCERNEFTTASRRLHPAKRWVFTAMVRALYPLADKVSGNATGVVEDISRVARLAPDAVCVIPNPAPELSDIQDARASAPPHPWLSDNRPVAIAMGRLVPQKDYPTMLRALAGADEALRLIVLGTGPDKDKLEALAGSLGLADRVDFVGFQFNRFDYLAQGDLFVLSSVTEGFPNALIEAISFGLPCVSTDCAGGGPRDILASTFPQALSPVGDSAAMARAMNDALRQPPTPEVIAALASSYSVARIADQFVAEVMA
ncbi:glycosyltransferase [Maritimibacter sp. DP1N21-5]|uniref:glycosyltransferase n=1 Tax=Maritimibacter sp. DP1N21-5 TaxID=2836867 RepID=UPI001C437507|nr:glycosyltransferase [Maritimibacter sp. DP1N21-5]MBV7410317.1 glycosyltransferase [Maritimibacter sp. DP1N21-5]